MWCYYVVMGLVKKSTLKQIGSWCGTMVLSLGIGLGIGSGASYLITDCKTRAYSTDDYAGDKQIEYLVDGLDNDTSYMKKQGWDFYRLAHNDGEPLPVAFEEGYDPKIKDIAIKTLDYTFGLLQDINPLYNYKLVTEEEFNNKARGINGIKYEVKNQKELSNLSTIAQANSNEIEKNANRIIEGEIYICRERLPNMTTDNMFYSLLHELFHLLGSDDVYLGTKSNPNNIIYRNTIMRPEADKDSMYCHKHLSPNDYDNLLAIYSPRCETEEEMANMLEVCKQKSNSYRDEYYKGFAEEAKKGDYVKHYTTQDTTKIKSMTIKCDIEYENQPIIYNSIEIKDDKYKMEYWANEGVFKDKVVATGNIIKYQDYIVLEKAFVEKYHIYVNFLSIKTDFVLFCLKGVNNTSYIIVLDMYGGLHGFYTQPEVEKIQENVSQKSLLRKLGDSFTKNSIQKSNNKVDENLQNLYKIEELTK